VAPQPRLTGACSSSFFTQPSNLIVLLGLIGLTLTRTRFARAGWRLAAGSLVLIGLIGFLPLGRALSLPLENRFPPWDTTGATPAGIVVLGGASSADMLATRCASADRSSDEAPGLNRKRSVNRKGNFGLTVP
jgi:uncharacterized SAM-binding protein YcdF (DUF218 family)